jgi:hypothetical protein
MIIVKRMLRRSIYIFQDHIAGTDGENCQMEEEKLIRQDNLICCLRNYECRRNGMRPKRVGGGIVHQEICTCIGKSCVATSAVVTPPKNSLTPPTSVYFPDSVHYYSICHIYFQ